MDKIVNGSCDVAVALVEAEKIPWPCRPSQIRLRKWSLPYVSFHSINAEEAAARLIYFSKKQSRWASVTWRELSEMVLLEKLQSTDDSGSGIFEFGDAFVRTGIKELVLSGFVQTHMDSGREHLFPTHKLIKMIVQLQKIRD